MWVIRDGCESTAEIAEHHMHSEDLMADLHFLNDM